MLGEGVDSVAQYFAVQPVLKVATLSLIWLVAASSVVIEEGDQFVSGPIRSIAFAVHSYG